MKFGEKLMQLRKKQGLSQEELAEKLGVSRQSVSKWESNNTYPETDKIVQICNIFDCSMDDLINDNITDINQTSRSNKINLNEAKDSFIEFITKTTNMFTNMSFAEGFKCLFKMLFIGFILYIVGLILCNTARHILGNIFRVANYSISLKIESLVKVILYLLWYILSIIIIIHIFNVKYLSKYEPRREVETNSETSATKEETTIIKKDTKSYTFLNVLANILIWIFKICIAWILIGFTIGIIIQIVLAIITATLIPTHILFLGIFLSLLGTATINIELVTSGICFIGNKKVNIKIFIVVFIVSIILCGIGISETILAIKNINIIEDTDNYYMNLEEQSLNLTYEEDLVIIKEDNFSYNTYEYIIDNTKNNDEIEVTTLIDPRYIKLEIDNYQTIHMDQMKEVQIRESFNGNFKAIFNLIKKDLKKNQIHIQTDNSIENQITTIKANEETINHLIINLKKLYLVDEQNEDNKITIEIKDDKVYFPYGIDGYYDAREDNIHINNTDNYECIRSITETEWGDKIIYSCHNKEENFE